jgi:catalase
VYIPGGEKSIDALTHQSMVIEFINEAYKHCKPIAASGEAVALLQQTSVEAKLASSKDVMSDMGIVTSQGKPSDKFNQAFIAAIAMHRHWVREKN